MNESDKDILYHSQYQQDKTLQLSHTHLHQMNHIYNYMKQNVNEEKYWK